MKLLLIFCFLFMSQVFAKPPYYNELTGKVPDGIWTFRCQTCHGGSSGRGLNEFGKDYFRLIRTNSFVNTPGLQLTLEQRWNSLLNLDSDKDGVNNKDEILKGTNPGAVTPSN